MCPIPEASKYLRYRTSESNAVDSGEEKRSNFFYDVNADYTRFSSRLDDAAEYPKYPDYRRPSLYSSLFPLSGSLFPSAHPLARESLRIARTRKSRKQVLNFMLLRIKNGQFGSLSILELAITNNISNVKYILTRSTGGEYNRSKEPGRAHGCAFNPRDSFDSNASLNSNDKTADRSKWVCEIRVDAPERYRRGDSVSRSRESKRGGEAAESTPRRLPGVAAFRTRDLSAAAKSSQPSNRNLDLPPSHYNQFARQNYAAIDRSTGASKTPGKKCENARETNLVTYCDVAYGFCALPLKKRKVKISALEAIYPQQRPTNLDWSRLIGENELFCGDLTVEYRPEFPVAPRDRELCIY